MQNFVLKQAFGAARILIVQKLPADVLLLVGRNVAVVQLVHLIKSVLLKGQTNSAARLINQCFVVVFVAELDFNASTQVTEIFVYHLARHTAKMKVSKNGVQQEPDVGVSSACQYGLMNVLMAVTVQVAIAVLKVIHLAVLLEQRPLLSVESRIAIHWAQISVTQLWVKILVCLEHTVRQTVFVQLLLLVVRTAVVVNLVQVEHLAKGFAQVDVAKKPAV